MNHVHGPSSIRGGARRGLANNAAYKLIRDVQEKVRWQWRVAEIARVSRSHISHVLHGEATLSIEAAFLLAHYLECLKETPQPA